MTGAADEGARHAIPDRDQQVRMFKHHPRRELDAQRGLCGECIRLAPVVRMLEPGNKEVADHFVPVRELEQPRPGRHRTYAVGAVFYLWIGRTTAGDHGARIVSARWQRIDRHVEIEPERQRRDQLPPARQCLFRSHQVGAFRQHGVKPRRRNFDMRRLGLRRVGDDVEHLAENLLDTAAMGRKGCVALTMSRDRKIDPRRGRRRSGNGRLGHAPESNGAVPQASVAHALPRARTSRLKERKMPGTSTPLV